MEYKFTNFFSSLTGGKVTPLWIIRQQTHPRNPQTTNYAKREKSGFCHVIAAAAAAAFPSLSCFYGSVNPRSSRHELRSLSKVKTTSNCETVRNNTLYALGRIMI
jgi:hypothetical protein